MNKMCKVKLRSENTKIYEEIKTSYLKSKPNFFFNTQFLGVTQTAFFWINNNCFPILACNPKDDCQISECSWRLPGGTMCTFKQSNSTAGTVCAENSRVTLTDNLAVNGAGCSIRVSGASSGADDGDWKCMTQYVTAFSAKVTVKVDTGLTSKYIYFSFINPSFFLVYIKKFDIKFSLNSLTFSFSIFLHFTLKLIFSSFFIISLFLLNLPSSSPLFN